MKTRQEYAVSRGRLFYFNESTRVTIIEEQGHLIQMKLGWHCFWKRMRHLQRMYCSTLTIWLVVLTPASGLHIMERKKKKKQVVGVLAHSLPMVLPEGLPWKQGVRQALGGPATAAGTSFLTGWWRHQLHTEQNNNYWREKREKENDASSVNCCVDEMFISEFGEHTKNAFRDHIAYLVIYRDLRFQSQEMRKTDHFLNMILFIRQHKRRGGKRLRGVFIVHCPMFLSYEFNLCENLKYCRNTPWIKQRLYLMFLRE